MGSSHKSFGLTDIVNISEVTCPEAERALIGGAIVDAKVRAELINLIGPTDLYEQELRPVYDCLCRLAAKGAPAEAAAMFTELNRVVDKTTGPQLVARLMDEACLPCSVPYYAREIRECSAKRNYVQNTVNSMRAGMGVDELRAIAEKSLREIDVKGLQCTSVGKVGAEALADLDGRMERGESMRGAPSPWAYLDELTCGACPRDLIVVAARPSVGKTAVMCCWARLTAERDWRTMIASLEMSNVPIAERLMADLADVPMQEIRKAHLHPDQRAALGRAQAHLASLPLEIIDRPLMRVADLYALAKSLPPRRGILFVDYLGLITPNEIKGVNRDQQIGQITHGLKGLAKALEIPVVLLCQLRRLPDGVVKPPPPKMDNLRESGNIEADADCIILLHRSDYGQAGAAPVSSMSLIVAKQRNGPTGIVEVLFDKPHQRVVTR